MRSRVDRAKEPGPRELALHPELTAAQIARGIVRRGLQPVPPKEAISLRVDQDVLDWFRAQGEGYQTRMNAVLRAFRDASR
jgi:uncharacterized protein (DUF4415 family)